MALTADRGRTAGERLVDPAVLSRLGNLDLVARIVVDGFVSGLHRARHSGVSTDFAEHRVYVPGDDVRHVDWRLYGRTDRLYLKLFEAETNADLVVAVDTSASMDYASGTHTKLDYARFVAATLTHLGSRQRDRVGLATFDSALGTVIPPSARHRDRVLHELARVEPGGTSDLPRALSLLGEALSRRGIIVVLSDLYLEPDAAARALHGLAARGHDVMVVHVLDHRELALDVDGPGVLVDLESDQRMAVDPARMGAPYRQLVTEHVAALRAACGAGDVDYALADTAEPLDGLLHHHLAARARLARGRRQRRGD